MLSVGEKISDNIYLCRDGAYRWVYEYNLYKRPGIFFLVWKILFCIITAGIVIAMISDAARWSDFFPDRFLTNLKFYAYFVIGMTVLSLISYLIYAMVMGGKYCIIFEMDEKGINHKQMPQQAKKAEMLAEITMMAGLASGSLTTLGVGASAARTEMYSEFSKVKAVKSYPRRHLIKVNGILSHNQVYADKNDFEFVQKYILDHCKNLKTTTTEK